MDKSRPEERHSSQLRFRRSLPGKVIQAKIGAHTQVEFCRHALDRMIQRRVTEKEVVDAIRKPTKSGLPTQPGRQRVRKTRSSTEAVDVVYASKGTTIIVVTVIVLRGKQAGK